MNARSLVPRPVKTPDLNLTGLLLIRHTTKTCQVSSYPHYLRDTVLGTVFSTPMNIMDKGDALRLITILYHAVLPSAKKSLC